MNRSKLILYAGLPLLVIVGATSYHLTLKNRELSKQRVVKTEGFVPVSVATVEERAFRGSIPFTGTLLAVNRAELRAEVSGRVTRVNVQEGDEVKAGTLLSTQDEDDLLLSVQAAEAQLAMAQTQADQANRDNDRAQMLLAKRSVTKQAAQLAETNFNATTANARAAQSNLGLAKSRLRKSHITAPFAGQVAQRLIQPGEVLNPGQTAFMVVDNRKLEIQADLPTEALATVKVGMKATFRVAGFDKPFEATLTQISPSVQPDGRTLRVRLEIPNTDNTLKSGLFAEGELVADSEAKKPALPSSLMTAVGNQADIFVIENGVARKRKIKVGMDQGGWRSVDDLPTGTQIVGQGRDQVADGTHLRIVQPFAITEGK
jgi:RND family efflux transporter MFP subunit